MGKNYYCEYCDRSFKDSLEARKKHIASLQHANNRSNHYKVFKDPEEILAEETKKIICKRFMKNECMFGESCRFSHYSPGMIMELRQMVAYKQQLSQQQQNSTLLNLQEMEQDFVQICQNASESEEHIHEMIYPSEWMSPYSYSTELFNQQQNLPPSLWPIDFRNMKNDQFAHWGR